MIASPAKIVQHEIDQMRAMYNLGAMDSLANYANKLIQEWGNDFLPPERKPGESQKKYNELVAKFGKDHYHRVVRKVQGFISQATMGGSAMLASDGLSLKDGDKLPAGGDRPLVEGAKKSDWTLPVAMFHAPKEGK